MRKFVGMFSFFFFTLRFSPYTLESRYVFKLYTRGRVDCFALYTIDYFLWGFYSLELSIYFGCIIHYESIFLKPYTFDSHPLQIGWNFVGVFNNRIRVKIHYLGIYKKFFARLIADFRFLDCFFMFFSSKWVFCITRAVCLKKISKNGFSM